MLLVGVEGVAGDFGGVDGVEDWQRSLGRGGWGGAVMVVLVLLMVYNRCCCIYCCFCYCYCCCLGCISGRHVYFAKARQHWCYQSYTVVHPIF